VKGRGEGRTGEGKKIKMGKGSRGKNWERERREEKTRPPI